MVAHSRSAVLTEESVKLPGLSILEFRELTLSSAKKHPGSKGFQQAWVTWVQVALDHILYEYSRNLPHPVDIIATAELEFDLGVAADVGEMPSLFADPGARSGYALDFLSCRVNRLAGMLISRYQDELLWNALTKFVVEQDVCRVTSIGGGPGFDYVAMCLVAAFMNNGRTESGGASIQGTIFDYETGWGDLVTSLGHSTRQVLDQLTRNPLQQQQQHSCIFGGKCDITKSLHDETNRDLLLEITASTDVFVCQYCVAENSTQLRHSKYIFFRDLFQQAREGALFILTEVTHRVWPDIVDLVVEGGGFDVTFVKNRSDQLVLQKRSQGATITSGVAPHVLARCAAMRRDEEMHARKLENGFVRQVKRVRGSQKP